MNNQTFDISVVFGFAEWLSSECPYWHYLKPYNKWIHSVLSREITTEELFQEFLNFNRSKQQQ